jgi:hypothetical protein
MPAQPLLPHRKPAKNARLRALPEPIQEEMLRRTAANNSWREIARWLKRKTGMDVRSDTTFSNWYSWRVLKQQLELQFDQVAQVKDFLRKTIPEIPEDKLERYGQAAFSTMALRTGDPTVWARIYGLQLKARQIAVEERRVKLLEQKATQADKAKDVAASTLSPDEKLDQIKRIFGIPEVA